jgi:hypothetical protein
VGGPGVQGGRFGYALVAGQMDGRNGDDLVVGAPTTDVFNQADAGRVYFYFAGIDGIIANDAYYEDASTLADHIAPVGDAHLGFSLAAGHLFQGSGEVDVAVGAPRHTVVDQNNAGSVLVFEFDGEDDDHDSIRELRQSSASGMTAPEAGDEFGHAVAIGRFRQAAHDDLAVGAPYEDVTEQGALGEQTNAGIFHVYQGGSGGPVDPQTFDHTTINNFVERQAHLGQALCFGSFENGSRQALAVGAPSADWVSYEQGGTDIDEAGAVHVVAPWRQPQNRPHRTSVLLDCDGFIIHGQRPFQRVRPASTTKALTLLLACEAIWDGEVDPQQFYTVPGWVADQVGGSQTPLVVGERLSFLGLMQTMMTVSGNDSAMLIGALLSGDGGPWEGFEGTSPAFAAMMNTRVQQLGLSAATNLTNAAGIDSGDHYVTALDWATLGYLAIQNECVRTIVDTSPWMVERVLPPGSSLDFFQYGDGGDGEISMTEAFFAGWVDGVKSRYDQAVGIKPGATPGGWGTGLSAAEPFGPGIAVASSFGTRRNDRPVEGVVAGCTTCLHAELLQFAEGYCDDGLPDDFFPTPDPGPRPWGTLTGIPPCPDEGVHAMTFNLGDEQTTPPGRFIQLDLMRGTHIAPTIEVLQMVKRLSQVEIARNELVPYGAAPHQGNQGLVIVNDGDDTASFEVAWGGTTTPFTLAPGEVATLPALTEETTSFEFHVQSTTGSPIVLGVTETYLYRMELADGVNAPDAHSVQLVRSGNLLAETVSTYVQGRNAECGDDTLDLVARADDSVPTAVGDQPLPPAPAATRLLPAYPNPFNPSTTIRFDLPRAGTVDLAVHDLRGRLVRTLASDLALDAGRHGLVWDGRDTRGATVASGVYLVVFRSGGQTVTRQMTLLK